MAKEDDKGDGAEQPETIDRLRAWARTPTKRKKVTAEDLKQRMESRAEARAAKPKRSAKSVAKTATTVAALVVTAWASLALNTARSEFDTAYAANATRIAQLEGELLEVSKPAVVEIDVVEAGAVIDEATLKAADVAELQNAYGGAQVTTTPDGKLAGVEEFKAVNDGLRALFTEGSRTGGALDPATQWFMMWDKGDDGAWAPSPEGSYIWTASRALELTTGTSARVVWELREVATGDLLAWATGIYDGDQEAFTAVTLSTTSYGDARVAPSDSGVDGSHHQITAPQAEEAEGETDEQD